MQRVIVVNGYPLRFSGAFQILKQFVRGVETYSLPNDKYYIFIDSSLELQSTSENIEFIPVKQNLFARAIFYFNFRGLNRELAKRGVNANKIISLANVNTRLSSNIEEYVYFHQPLTIYPHKWSPLKKTERVLWLYQKYYKWVIKKSLTKRTNVIAQLDCICNRVSETFGVNPSHILKVFPNIIIPAYDVADSIEIDPSVINCIYPATPFKYKNHEILFDALNSMQTEYSHKVRLYLTCLSSDILFNIPSNDSVDVVFLGHISFDELMSLYHKMDALLFPSYIESFGLPMIEAASTGIKVIAADTDFANEVLRGYSGVTYIPALDHTAWAKEISNINKKERFSPIHIDSNDSWKILFDNINKQ